MRTVWTGAARLSEVGGEVAVGSAWRYRKPGNIMINQLFTRELVAGEDLIFVSNIRYGADRYR